MSRAFEGGFMTFNNEESYVSRSEISQDAKERLALRRAKNQRRGAQLLKITSWM